MYLKLKKKNIKTSGTADQVLRAGGQILDLLYEEFKGNSVCLILCIHINLEHSPVGDLK